MREIIESERAECQMNRGHPRVFIRCAMRRRAVETRRIKRLNRTIRRARRVKESDILCVLCPSAPLSMAFNHTARSSIAEQLLQETYRV
ncbi:hypothetical protein AWC35_15680 [Gibbsiella quercinecans]|uniref:Uncharacterized protein n=1 Tax=Gibbsiella quercinecans TaxID=929813 RepID=A0A250B3N1_9GAMM|nr:hypothetical protein AWC35_15680 [Gibbsiella quercinecans]RLM09977.1 hypothetical protein BIY30_10630 [Gibbsiella quercinecans]RLM10621.1 hypothetical protein BIY31_05860 [Gibbsiella quercinecans]